MTGKPPVKLRWRAAHLFEASAEGGIVLKAANVMLERRT
jgi:hypothetical protein